MKRTIPTPRPFRSLPNVLATPHRGYVGDNLYRTFYTTARANPSLAGATPRVGSSGVSGFTV